MSISHETEKRVAPTKPVKAPVKPVVKEEAAPPVVVNAIITEEAPVKPVVKEEAAPSVVVNAIITEEAPKPFTPSFSKVKETETTTTTTSVEVTSEVTGVTADETPEVKDEQTWGGWLRSFSPF